MLTCRRDEFDLMDLVNPVTLPALPLRKVQQDVREYAAQKEADEQAALDAGMKEKAEEFVEMSAEIYGRV
jgi:hypothetical protein